MAPLILYFILDPKTAPGLVRRISLHLRSLLRSQRNEGAEAVELKVTVKPYVVVVVVVVEVVVSFSFSFSFHRISYAPFSPISIKYKVINIYSFIVSIIY
jgi:hypothetical protein